MLIYRLIQTCDGIALLGWYDHRIAVFVFPQSSPEKGMERMTTYHLPPYDQIERGKTSPDPTLEEKIISYFEGKPVDFPEPVYLDHLSPFCQIVLQMIRSIPRGQAMTYKQVAKMVNHPRAARAVGQVMSMNPIPLIIPCHRVIAHDHLGGFGFGLPWKAHLLSLEHFNLDSLPHRSSFYPPPGKEQPTV